MLNGGTHNGGTSIVKQLIIDAGFLCCPRTSRTPSCRDKVKSIKERVQPSWAETESQSCSKITMFEKIGKIGPRPTRPFLVDSILHNSTEMQFCKENKILLHM